MKCSHRPRDKHVDILQSCIDLHLVRRLQLSCSKGRFGTNVAQNETGGAEELFNTPGFAAWIRHFALRGGPLTANLHSPAG